MAVGVVTVAFGAKMDADKYVAAVWKEGEFVCERERE